MPTRSSSSRPISTAAADFARRDADLARVVPIMVRMLPERVIATVARAMELNALSQELDRALLARLPRADGRFTRRRVLPARIGAWTTGRRANARSELIGEIGVGARRLRAEAADRTAHWP